MSLVSAPPHLHREIHPPTRTRFVKPAMGLGSGCLGSPYQVEERFGYRTRHQPNPYSEPYEPNYVKPYPNDRMTRRIGTLGETLLTFTVLHHSHIGDSERTLSPVFCHALSPILIGVCRYAVQSTAKFC